MLNVKCKAIRYDIVLAVVVIRKISQDYSWFVSVRTATTHTQQSSLL